MKILKITIIALLFCAFDTLAQVGINNDGSTPNASALIDAKSVSKGALLPRMTLLQRNAITSPAEGLMVYCTDCATDGSGTLCIFTSGSWKTYRKCNTPSPVSATPVPSPGQILWKWNAADGTEAGYKWNTTNNYGSATDMGTQKQKTETGITCPGQYTRYVWAYYACGISDVITMSYASSSSPSVPTPGTQVPSFNSVTWNWNAASGATGYKWNTINDLNTATDIGLVLTKSETGLSCNTGYTRYLWAYNNCGFSTALVLTATTLTVPSSPNGIPVVVSTNQITWNWYAIPGAAGYKWNTLNNYSTAVDLGNVTTKTESGLQCNTTYTRYLWAYNTCGPSTVNTLVQTTIICPVYGTPCPGVAPFFYQGTNYHSVQIGTQCWLRENLNIGTRIDLLSDQMNNNMIEKYCYNDSDSMCNIFGGLYQWDEMMNYTSSSSANPSGRQGICPSGWHLPSEAEWCQMEYYLDTTASCSIPLLGWVGTDIGGKLKEVGNDHWQSPNVGATNSSGFTALGGGYRDESGSCSQKNVMARFWTCTVDWSESAWNRDLACSVASRERIENMKTNGFSVRCVKN